MRAYVLDLLRRSKLDAEFEHKLKCWRSAVMEKVASMQFDSVEEIYRQLGLPRASLTPLPFQKWQQQTCYMDGSAEVDDVAVLPPRATESQAPWATAEGQGPSRRRPFVALQENAELDPHDYENRDVRGKLLPPSVARKKSMRGACLSLCPQWRRKPAYRTLPDGTARMCVAEGADFDAEKWKRAFAADARMNYIRSHIHRCGNTCWKNRHSGGRVCRFNFNHEFFVIAFGRQAPRRVCKRKDCCLKGQFIQGSAGSSDILVHPDHCPPPAMRGKIKSFLRKGKDLVLPRLRLELPDGTMAYCKLHGCPPGSDWHDELYEYHAQVCEDERFGRGGRVMVLRYHPQVSSSNPVGQCLLRCNWGVQCMDRVIRFPAAWLAGTPPAQRECCDEVVCVESGGQQHALDAPMDATPGPRPEERVGAQLTSLPGGARLQSFDDSEASAGFDEGDEPSDGEGFDCPPDDVHASATAAPAHPHSDQPVPDAVQSEGELVRLLFLDAAERMFRDAEDSSHYTGDYD